MVVYKCDRCGITGESSQFNKIQLPLGDRNLVLDGFCEPAFYTKDVCNSCYNIIMYAALDSFNSLDKDASDLLNQLREQENS